MREREGNLIKDVLTGRCSLQSYFLFCFCVCWKETQSWINKNKLSSFNGHGCCKGVTEPPILSLLPTSLLLKWQCSSGMYFIFIFYPYNSISTQVTTAERTVHSRWPLGRLSALGSCSHVLGKKRSLNEVLQQIRTLLSRLSLKATCTLGAPKRCRRCLSTNLPSSARNFVLGSLSETWGPGETVTNLNRALICFSTGSPPTFQKKGMRRSVGFFSQVTSNRTWRNGLRLLHGRFRLKNKKNFFVETVVKHWNRLCRTVVEFLSLEVFKSCVDMALRSMA